VLNQSDLVYLPIRTAESLITGEPGQLGTVTTWLRAKIVTLSAAPGTVPPCWRALLALEDGTFRVADLTECRHELDSDAVRADEVFAWRRDLHLLDEALGALRVPSENTIAAACRVISDMDVATKLAKRLVEIEAEKEQLIAEAGQLMAESNAEIERLKVLLADALPKGHRLTEDEEPARPYGDRLPEHES
jgi:hypothetical protein